MKQIELRFRVFDANGAVVEEDSLFVGDGTIISCPEQLRVYVGDGVLDSDPYLFEGRVVNCHLHIVE